MSAHRIEHLDMCAALALGVLGDAERAELEAHLDSGCPECAEALAREMASVRLLAASAPPLAPPAALRARVLVAAAREGREGAPAGRVIPLQPRPRPVATWAWAVAAVALAVAGAFAWNDAGRLRRELETTRDRLARAERDLSEERAWASLTDSPGVRAVSLTPTPQGTAIMRARATYDPSSHRAVIAFENVSLPPGHDYQLWALRGTAVASLGVIHADAAGRAIVRVPDAGDPATLGGFAVSLEREGGSSNPAAPEGPVVMAGTFPTQ